MKLSPENLQEDSDNILDHTLYFEEKNGDTLEKLTNIELPIRNGLKEIIEEGSSALNQLVLSKRAPRALADVHSKLVSYILKTSKETKKNLQSCVSDTLRDFRIGLNKINGGIDNRYDDEVTYDQFGVSRERGVLADIDYLKSVENVPPHAIRKNFSNALLDNTHGIDYVTTTLYRDEGGHSKLEVDLVQVKSDISRLEKRDTDLIVRKHKDFIHDFDFVFAEMKAKEVPLLQLENFISDLGTLRSLFVREAWDIANTENDIEQASEWLIASLVEFREDVKSTLLYKNASNSLKYSYISKMGNYTHIDDDPKKDSPLGRIFDEWKRRWLEEINVKMERTLNPVGDISYRIVVYGGGGKKEVITINNESIDNDL